MGATEYELVPVTDATKAQAVGRLVALMVGRDQVLQKTCSDAPFMGGFKTLELEKEFGYADITYPAFPAVG